MSTLNHPKKLPTKKEPQQNQEKTAPIETDQPMKAFQFLMI